MQAFRYGMRLCLVASMAESSPGGKTSSTSFLRRSMTFGFWSRKYHVCTRSGIGPAGPEPSAGGVLAQITQAV